MISSDIDVTKNIDDITPNSHLMTISALAVTIISNQIPSGSHFMTSTAKVVTIN